VLAALLYAPSCHASLDLCSGRGEAVGQQHIQQKGGSRGTTRREREVQCAEHGGTAAKQRHHLPSRRSLGGRRCVELATATEKKLAGGNTSACEWRCAAQAAGSRRLGGGRRRFAVACHQ
jgi:hypothetical protein